MKGEVAVAGVGYQASRRACDTRNLLKSSSHHLGVVFAALLAFPATGQSGKREEPADGVYLPSFERQSEDDEYTRYELLAPETASFRIYYEVTATTSGARVFYNPIRKGSQATEESVRDAMTGEPLAFEVVSGADARADPLMADAETDVNYIKVHLARPVPVHGGGRIRSARRIETQRAIT